ncbi:microprocessor complex subunit DGCR8 [Galendromus occidentalis]|uniref:Microprocessor complex subunit DGCR8 n=1 Tax=Galendromus occidentalis TaxID=34638 RepID=A0AAJ7SGK5_9ACAR|nr:microprocessor complex subunit DGCR8 [Galendromus occidentalis]
MSDSLGSPPQTDVLETPDLPPLPPVPPPPIPPPPIGVDEPTPETPAGPEDCANSNKRKADFSSDDDSEDSVASDEIDKLLDESLKEARKAEDVIIRKKLICKRYTKDVYDILPEDWVMINHICGLPLYLNRKTRVCTWSRPYFLGPGSARKHEVPQSAIPCLHYERIAEKSVIGEASAEPMLVDAPKDEVGSEQRPTETSEENAPSEAPSTTEAATTGDPTSLTPQQLQVMNKVGIETAQECQVHLNAEQLRDYAKSRFDIEEVTVRQFKSWGARREFQREKKVKNPPTLPSSTHLITCEIPSSGVRNKRKEFVLNPYGKGPVGILHEFVQHSLREQPKYTFKELASSETPYCATLLIAEVEYGTGYGSSKKQAKTAAAQAALDILLPSWRGLQKSDEKDEKDPAQASKQHELDFFDDIAIEDPRLAGLCTTTGQQSPFHILVECLRRNFGLVNESEIKHQVLKENEKSQRIVYQMSVGSHTVKVRAKNKRDGKQLASQQLLAKMHQYISTWGGILRLYGHNSYKTPRDKRQEQQAITDLQTKSTATGPNHFILSKLQEEMLKLPAEQREAQGAGSNNMNMVKM